MPGAAVERTCRGRIANQHDTDARSAGHENQLAEVLAELGAILQRFRFLVRDGVGCMADRGADVFARQMRVGIDQIGFRGSLGQLAKEQLDRDTGAANHRLAKHDVRIDSAELTDIQPAEYRADLVVLLLDGVPVFGIVVEAQLAPDERKRFVWPAYVVNLRARLEVPVCLLVVTPDEGTARWAAGAVELGGGNRFVPLVLGPSGVPEVIDEGQARDDPELAVLSAMAHGRDADYGKAAQIALAAQMASLGLDEDRSRLYFDLVLASLSEAARTELRSMDPAKYEYQSEFARRYVAQGRLEGKAEGEIEGRAALVTRQLEQRFGPLGTEARAQIAQASIDDLDAIGERLLNAKTLEGALSPPRR